MMLFYYLYLLYYIIKLDYRRKQTNKQTKNVELKIFIGMMKG